MGRILSVGIVCLDLVFVAERYPEEDTENLVEQHSWSRGGNASNTSSVLAYLGADVEFLGTLVESRWLEFLKDDFREIGVKFDNCIILDKTHKSPVAAIITSKQTGSRTAFPDFRGVTELSFAHFDQHIQIEKYKWMHFEGRRNNSADIQSMITKVKQFNEKLSDDEEVIISVEIEQPHSICPELFPLFKLADVIFVSKDYAKEAGCTNKEDAVKRLYGNCKSGAILICAWGEEGAAARSDDEIFSSQAFPPERIVDTLGAGDTFNAAVIYALHRGCSVSKALEFACRVAGTKCGQQGFAGTKGMQNSL